MNRDEVIVALYNRKVQKKDKVYFIWDSVLGCNVPVTSHISFLKNEEWINPDMTFTKEGKEELMRILTQRMKK